MAHLAARQLCFQQMLVLCDPTAPLAAADGKVAHSALHLFHPPVSFIPWHPAVVCCYCVATASHVEYLVTTRSRLPGWSAEEVAVRRRFRDFVALAELLKVTHSSAQHNAMHPSIALCSQPQQITAHHSRAHSPPEGSTAYHSTLHITAEHSTGQRGNPQQRHEHARQG